MRTLGITARVGVFAFVLILLREVMDHPMWGESAAGAPTTVDFAVSILDDWAIVTIVLGILLSMAMIGGCCCISGCGNSRTSCQNSGICPFWKTVIDLRF